MLSPTIKSRFFFLPYVSLLLLFQLSFASLVPNDVPLKRQAPAVAPLVDFEVYEPVLTPTGTSDQYGCIYTKLLMSYEFGNSYGAPFVGMCLCLWIDWPTAVTDKHFRRLHTSPLLFQSRDHELYRHIQRPAIRPTGPDVPW